MKAKPKGRTFIYLTCNAHFPAVPFDNLRRNEQSKSQALEGFLNTLNTVEPPENTSDLAFRYPYTIVSNKGFKNVIFYCGCNTYGVSVG